MLPIDPLFYASFIGSIAFAFSGYMLGVRRELDIVGLFIVSMLTANGGGVVRDVLLGRVPGVLTDISAFWLVLAVVIISIIFRLHRYSNLEQRLFFVISDSVGLVAFSITGASMGIEHDLNYFGVLLLAFLTATGGGIVRDILLNEVPTVLSSGFYGSVALIVGSVMYAFSGFDMKFDWYIPSIFVLALALRLIAHFRGWRLPKVKQIH